MNSKKLIKGRGAQGQVQNRFFEHSQEPLDDYLDQSTTIKTSFIKTFPKTIVNKVTSPDVGMNYSLNPYQGCEHGCVYCYARNSHEYWGYGAGLDFESKILIKPTAPQLLEKYIKRKSWQGHPIVLSGNTDCYQPIEKKLQITRQLLQVFLKHKHPVAIITKNGLVLRDLDILTQLAADGLCRVILSIATLSETTRQLMEPRTSTIKKRLGTIEKLTQAGIPVMVMAGPVIPGINSHESLPLVKEVSERGVLQVGYTIVRLNGAIGGIFTQWLQQAFPDRAAKVLHAIKQCHSGRLENSLFGKRIKGEGPIAKQIKRQFEIAKRKYLKDKELPPLNTELHQGYKDGQLKLF